LIAVLQAYPEFVHYLLAPEQIANFHQMYDPANRRLGSREADSSLMMFCFYIWNNIRIGFQTFAGGLLAGVGSIWFLAANGVVIGAVAGYLTQVGYTQTFWSFVAGHSSLELVAIAIAGAAGLRLGMAVISPGNVSRRAALVAAARPAVRLMYGAAMMFLAAAFVEAFWSPLTEFGFQTKIIVGIAGWVLLLGYFLLAGRSSAAR
ncbi:MAG TPA: stage II sporulation protein M, partial [Burkholderiales bacterium]|nr:stage II sporulation protein M [Burkholderiales bacterium]